MTGRLFLNVLVIALFGVVCIFSATTTSVTETPATIMEMLETQSVSYARLQLIWLGVGIVAMMVVIYFGYGLYGHYANTFYVLNLLLLVIVLGMEAGRGGMTAFFTWGSGSERTFQPSEVGKIAMIIAFAKAFYVRTKPVMTVRDLLPLALYMGIPLMLIIAQPDVGTALVYLAVFCIMVFVSGTKLQAHPRRARLRGGAHHPGVDVHERHGQLPPHAHTHLARPGELPGRGAAGHQRRHRRGARRNVGGRASSRPAATLPWAIFPTTTRTSSSPSAARASGMVGACALVLLYMLLLGRLFYLALRVQDSYGAYLIVGVASMLLFHIVENICMVIGLLPVTGIPLPFMSYGGSNMITNMMGIGLVMNVVMRSRSQEYKNQAITSREVRL